MGLLIVIQLRTKQEKIRLLKNVMQMTIIKVSLLVYYFLFVRLMKLPVFADNFSVNVQHWLVLMPKVFLHGEELVVW